MNRIRVSIPPGTNFNKPVVVERGHELLNTRLISLLPDLLGEGVNLLEEPNDKQVFLVSALAVLSGVLPNYVGKYDGKSVRPNLYAFILGDYGTGKGAAEYGRRLIGPIEDSLDKENEAAEISHKIELSEWKSQPKSARGGGGNPPVRPKRVGLVIPANSSASAFTQQLSEYNGRGVLFETEGDTLAQTLASDHGNYSDVLRKCFHHETVSLSRRANDEHIKLKNPELSVLLTGTPGQLRNLVPDTANGLFSRFMYLTIHAEEDFRDVFAEGKNSYEKVFSELGQKVFTLHKALSEREEPLTFTFTDQQKRKFVAAYRADKSGFIGKTGTEATGTYHRLALINFRLAMILSVLRKSERPLDDGSQQITCTDDDYQAAKRLTEILTGEVLHVYYGMPETDAPEDEAGDDVDPELVEGAELVSGGLSIRNAANRVGVTKSKLGRYCNRKGISSGQKAGRPPESDD